MELNPLNLYNYIQNNGTQIRPPMLPQRPPLPSVGNESDGNTVVRETFGFDPRALYGAVLVNKRAEENNRSLSYNERLKAIDLAFKESLKQVTDAYSVKKVCAKNSSVSASVENHNVEIEEKETSEAPNRMNSCAEKTDCSLEPVKQDNGKLVDKIKQLEGSVRRNLLEAKDLILSDMGIPADLVNVEYIDQDGASHASTTGANGNIEIYLDSTSKSLDEHKYKSNKAICMLRHELDHLIVFTKLYKILGPEKFERLVFLHTMDPNEQVTDDYHKMVDFSIYEKLAPYVDTGDFDSDKYINAMVNYDKNTDYRGIEISRFRYLTAMQNNYDNDFERSARDAQYELEESLDVTTLKDIYAMLDSKKNIEKKIENYKVNHPIMKEIEKMQKLGALIENDYFTEIVFDELFDLSMEELGIEDTPKTSSIIIKNAEKYLEDTEENKELISNIYTTFGALRRHSYIND